MTTIYLAGPWHRKDDVRLARAQFRDAGIRVLADWIDHHNGSHTAAELQAEAFRDLMQIDEADALVVLQLEKSEGKSAELMFAYCNYRITSFPAANRRPIIVVGEHDLANPVNVFHYLPGILRVHTIEEAIHALREDRPSQRLVTTVAHDAR
jgi:hypothetical protein